MTLERGTVERGTLERGTVERGTVERGTVEWEISHQVENRAGDFTSGRK